MRKTKTKKQKKTLKLGFHRAIKLNSIAKFAIDQTLSPKWR